MDNISSEVEKGLQHFNQGDFYEAHEYFETAWRQTDDPLREFYRALIHVSGGFFRLTQERPGAAKKFFTHALRWLREFPSPILGIDTAALKAHLLQMIEAIDQNRDAESILQQYKRSIPLKRNHSRH